VFGAPLIRSDHVRIPPQLGREDHSRGGVSARRSHRRGTFAALPPPAQATRLPPTPAPFLGRRLIQHLVTSNPSPAYLERVSRAYQSAHRAGEPDLAAIVKAILLDPEARDLNPPATFGKKREPLLMLTAMARSLEPRFDLKFSMCDTPMAHTIKHNELTATLRHPGATTGAPGEPGICRSYSFGHDLGQDIWDAPSVFNWFTPD